MSAADRIRENPEVWKHILGRAYRMSMHHKQSSRSRGDVHHETMEVIDLLVGAASSARNGEKEALQMLARVLEAVPLPDVMRFTGSVGEAIDYLTTAIREREFLRETAKALIKAHETQNNEAGVAATQVLLEYVEGLNG